MSEELLKLLSESPFNSIKEVIDYQKWFNLGKDKNFTLTFYDFERMEMCNKILEQQNKDLR